MRFMAPVVAVIVILTLAPVVAEHFAARRAVAEQHTAVADDLQPGAYTCRLVGAPYSTPIRVSVVRQ